MKIQDNEIVSPMYDLLRGIVLFARAVLAFSYFIVFVCVFVRVPCFHSGLCPSDDQGASALLRRQTLQSLSGTPAIATRNKKR